MLHEQLYGFRMPGTASEIVNLRAVGSGAVPKPELPTGCRRAARTHLPRSPTSTRSCSTASGCRRSSTTARLLAPGNRFDGPAIVTEFDSTTVVLPGYVAEVDENFNILINPKAQVTR